MNVSGCHRKLYYDRRLRARYQRRDEEAVLRTACYHIVLPCSSLVGSAESPVRVVKVQRIFVGNAEFQENAKHFV